MEDALSTRTFHAAVTSLGRKTVIVLPFEPAVVWGERERHHIHGTINGKPIRGPLAQAGEQWLLALGDAWRRDNGVEVGTEVEVVLQPEGPQSATSAPDIAAALAGEEAARSFFDALPTFYRKNFMRWIDSAKRAETRAARIAEMVALLRAGKREREAKKS